MIERIKLGEVDYFGEEAEAYREIYPHNVWRFVIIIKKTKEKKILASY